MSQCRSGKQTEQDRICSVGRRQIFQAHHESPDINVYIRLFQGTNEARPKTHAAWLKCREDATFSCICNLCKFISLDPADARHRWQANIILERAVSLAWPTPRNGSSKAGEAVPKPIPLNLRSRTCSCFIPIKRAVTFRWTLADFTVVFRPSTSSLHILRRRKRLQA